MDGITVSSDSRLVFSWGSADTSLLDLFVAPASGDTPPTRILQREEVVTP